MPGDATGGGGLEHRCTFPHTTQGHLRRRAEEAVGRYNAMVRMPRLLSLSSSVCLTTDEARPSFPISQHDREHNQGVPAYQQPWEEGRLLHLPLP